MKQVEEFIENVHRRIERTGLDDAIDLLPLFERLALINWQELLISESGSPQTTVLYQSHKIKLILIYWEAGHCSSVHGHPLGGGLIRILSGRLEETRYDPVADREIIDRTVLDKGQLSYIHDMLAYHRVCNPDTRPAVSLHLYSTLGRRSA